MRRIIEFIKYYIAAIALLFTFTACDNKDDLQDIFIGREWHLAFIQEGDVRKAPEKEYSIAFNNATFTLTTPSDAQITGRWQATNDPRTFQCNGIKTSGSIDSDETAKAIQRILAEARTYNGDTNYLQIIAQPGNVYMQFYNR